MYAYDMLTSESDWEQPCLIARHIHDDHYGTILTGIPIDLSENGYRDLTADDFVWPTPKDRPTVAEFAERYGLDLSPPTRASVEKSVRQLAR